MVYGVVLAGGVGSRMGGDKPKQYLTVKDKPIIIYTIEKFISVPQLEKILVLRFYPERDDYECYSLH